jgi:GTPase SAR1 family protein
MWRDKESPGRTIKVGIFGASGSGKKSFVRALSGYPGEKGEFIDVSELGSGATTGILYGGACRQVRDFRTAASVGPDTNRESRRQSLLRRPNVFIIAAAVTPEGTRDWLALHGESLDVAVVMFSCDESEAANTTLDVAIGLEKLLPKEVPRVFVANKSDLLPEVPREDAGAQLSTFAKDVGNDSFTTSNHIANDLIARTETYLREHHPRHGSVKLVSAKSLEGFEDVVRTVIDTASRPISNTFSRVGLYNGMLVWGGLLTALSAATFAGIAVYFSDRKLQKYATEVYDEARTICRGVVNVTLSMLPVFGH